jgi:hypothetical protein
MSRNAEFHSYRGRHQPPAESPGMHEADQMYPDYYERPEIYTGYTNPAVERESMRHILRVRGNADAPVTVYRAVPHGVSEINPGDWVTQSAGYAKNHGRHPTDPSQDMPVISKKVRAGELTTEGNSIHEWGWNPR